MKGVEKNSNEVNIVENELDKVDNYSKYDCELVDTESLEHQDSAYYNVEKFQPFVSDEDITIPKGFDPYSVEINLKEPTEKFIFKRPNEMEDRPRPISSFTNEQSVFYDEKKDKMFSKRFRLKK